MSRPEHLNCVNTASGIDRINREQEYYDIDPEGYEQQQRAEDEARQQEAYFLQQQEDEWRNNQEQQY